MEVGCRQTSASAGSRLVRSQRRTGIPRTSLPADKWTCAGCLPGQIPSAHAPARDPDRGSAAAGATSPGRSRPRAPLREIRPGTSAAGRQASPPPRLVRSQRRTSTPSASLPADKRRRQLALSARSDVRASRVRRCRRTSGLAWMPLPGQIPSAHAPARDPAGEARLRGATSPGRSRPRAPLREIRPGRSAAGRQAPPPPRLVRPQRRTSTPSASLPADKRPPGAALSAGSDVRAPQHVATGAQRGRPRPPPQGTAPPVRGCRGPRAKTRTS